jgi:hypothetical protein
MDTWVTTLEELKKIRFSKFDKVFCKETQREYYIEPNGGSLTPDDLDIIQAAQGGTWRLVAQSASGGGGGGEVNTGANVGAGAGIFRNKTGAQLNFKSLTAGTGVTLTPSADEIQIAASGGGSSFPWPVKFVSSDTTLTLADQGVIVQTGGIITLPASAPNGTVFRIYGSPGVVRINSNGNLITGIGTGSDLRPGEPALQLVAINTPSLIWATENRLFLDVWNAARKYRAGEIVRDGGHNYYLSRTEENNQPLTNTAAWLPISPRRVTGTIAFSDISVFGDDNPSGLLSGTYTISECGDALMLSIRLMFSETSTNVTAVQISSAKSSEIHNAFFVAYGGSGAENNVSGYGYAYATGSYFTAKRADVMYSPLVDEKIVARFDPVNNITEVNMRVLMQKL